MRVTKLPVALALLAAALLGLVLLIAANQSAEDSDPGSANPRSQAPDYQRALAGAPAPLAAVYAQGDVLLDGGVEAFEQQLAELRGHPVVVNKWASWCGPCRFELPFFQSQAAKRGKRVAFLGVNTDDSDDAATTFLEQIPLPYPSYSDPDSEIADLLDAREFPSTAFYDSGGELVYVRRGGYGSEQELAGDIRRWAS